MATDGGHSFSSIAGGITQLSAPSTLSDDHPNPASVGPEPISQSAPVNPPPEGEPASPVKRGVGRPKGSKNKAPRAPPEPGAERRPVGRPRGSGKKKDPSEPTVKRPVGRPRKDGLPPGSANRTMTFSTLVPPTSASAPVNSWVPFSGSISAPVIPSSVIDPALHNEWAELAHSRPEEFLGVLLAALQVPPLGPSVEDAFKAHLGSLAPPATPASNSANVAAQQTIPSLYSILKTFWLPSSPNYFALTASATSARTLTSHRFLYWDPQPLVFNGIACPTCACPLTNRGRIRTGPIAVHDLTGPFFVIGCVYICANNHSYASTDEAVRRALPDALEHEFPARLPAADMGVGADVWNWQARGVSRALWNLVVGALNTGLLRDVILRLLHDVQHGVPESPVKMEEDADADADEPVDGSSPPMEEEEGSEDAVQAPGSGQGDIVGGGPSEAAIQPPPPPPPGMGPPPPGFDPAWAAASIDYRNNPYARFAVPMYPPPIPGMIPYDPVAQRKREYPFGEPDVGSSGQGIMSAGDMGPPAKKTRNPRHCCKCGSQSCKGKGGRNFCTNACMDCGKFECQGRNSRRPDKTCDAGWPEGQAPPQVQAGEGHPQGPVNAAV
ncbi:hypothetical protein R3P38DRAFT_2700054 [Favolaschia claudopus]|uniref:Uncharacterized protein n=1 Tax=Favolaschia claudopus TaxID=2862362 RepID=A0AAW0C258_9AGAR